ncbi:MAG: hypothetical protein ACREMY_27475, partial [bacterium]
MLSFSRELLARTAGTHTIAAHTVATHTVATWVLASAIVFAVLGGATFQAAAQGAVKSVHNDWQVRCDTPPGAQGEQCALIQSVTAEDRANVGLTVIVLK